MIIPALDINHGKIVRLYQGSYQMQFNYGDPIYYLKKYINQGAQMIHLVDLTGVRNTIDKQSLLIHALIKEASPLSKIQIGGGIRNPEEIEYLLKSGANRVVIGSMAVTHPKTVKKWFNYFDPNKLVIAIDIRIHSATQKHKVVIHGWEKETDTQLAEIIEKYQPVGLKHVLCTDVSKDGTLLGCNIKLYRSICQIWPNILFQSSGGVKNLSEISQLQSSGVNSIIIGRAFLEKKFTVQEAILCWQKE